MHARHRRTTVDDTSPDVSYSLITVGDIDVDEVEEKKYNKKWNFTQISKENIPFFGAISNKLSEYSYPSKQNTPSSNNHILASDQTITDTEDLVSLNQTQEIETMMTSRDRTVEFSNAIRSLQGPNIVRAMNVADPKKVKQLQNYSEFMMIAKHIGKNIANTYSKLEKLTLLAKRKSLFDDRTTEIHELTYIIKGDLNALNQQIARLQDISKSQRKTSSGNHLMSHSSNMVIALQSKLANMSSDFKQILEVRTENLKQQKSRRDHFSQGQVSNTLPKQGSLLLAEQDQVSYDMGGANQPFLPQNNIQQQRMLMYDESDNYVQQRAETMQNIESTIVELGGIFQQLAHMVKEQEEMVDRIDTNIQDTELNVEAAHSEILKYFQSVTKNRWLMIKIFGVLIVFFIFFVIFLG